MSTDDDITQAKPDAATLDTSPAPVSQSTSRSSADAEGAITLRAELAEMRDRWMRSEAEIVNVRARAKRDVQECQHYAVQKFATDVVETAENLRRGINSLPPASDYETEDISALRMGLVEIERSFVHLLERNGLKKVDPTGSAFDPNLHQATATKESSACPAGTVLTSLAPLWTLNGRLIRAAMVVVSKAPLPESAKDPARLDEIV